MTNRGLLRTMDNLISTADLENTLASDDLRIFDCSVAMQPKPDGSYEFLDCRSQWSEEHVAGAGYLSLCNALSDSESPLPFMMPSQDQFVSVMSRAGVGEGSRVVLYNHGPGWWAMRVWWMLRAFGFDSAAVLDGGWNKWKAEGRPTTSGESHYPEAVFPVGARRDVFVGADDVLGAIDDEGVVIINALAPESLSR